MSTNVKKWLFTLVAGLGFPLLIFLGLYFSTWGTYPVPATLSTDSQLPTLTTADFKVHGEIVGPAQAPLIVVIHDGPGSDYRSLLPLKALSDTHRILFYDQMGTGLSPRVPNTELGIKQSLKRLSLLIDTYAEGQPVSLIGHGWGGMLASAYAGEHPQQIEHMALLEPGFLNAEMAGQVLPALSRSTLGFITGTILRWVKALHVSGPDSDAREDFIFARIRHQPLFYCDQKVPDNWGDYNWRTGFRSWKTITQSTLDESGKLHLDFTKGLEKLNTHVLIVAGACNPVTGRSFQARQTRLFKQASVAQVAKSGHELLMDNPTATLDILRAYLAGRYFDAGSTGEAG
jgi:proline iminopeptidase